MKGEQVSRKCFSFLLIVMMGVLVAGNAFSAGSKEVAQERKVITIKIANGTASDHPENVGSRYFEKLVEERTGGRVDVQVYDRGQLGSQKDFVEGLGLGTIEITMVTIGFFSSYSPILNVYELPYLYDSPDQAYRATEGPLLDHIKSNVEKHNVKILSFWEAGTRHITNNVKPIQTPADLNRLKIRVPPAKINVDTFNTLGASAAPLAFPELYMALQQGVFDGQENPLSNIHASKFYEVQDYLSLSGHQFLIHMFMYSGNRWKELPTDIQQIVQEAAKEAAKYQRNIVHEEDAKLLNVLKEKGMKVNSVDVAAFRKAVEPLYARYITEYGADAKQIIDTIRATK